jgi:hypothetical protein
MAKKKKKKKAREEDDSADGLWISPRSLLKGANGERAWENRPGGVPNSSRFLELADLALGLKKPEPRKKRVVTGTHISTKTDPYSQQR